MNNSSIYTHEWMNGFATAMRYMGAKVPAPYAASYYFRNDDTHKLLDAIKQTIEKDLGLIADSIYSKSRKQQTVFLRSCAWIIYHEISGATQVQTAEAFGCSRSRCTYVNMRRSAMSLMDAYPEYRKQFQILKSGVMLRYMRSNAAMQKQFEDLGLPSGTLWSTVNIPGTHPTGTARSLAGDELPTYEQARELLDHCTITYDITRMFFNAQGPNGKSIAIPADGFTRNGIHNPRNRSAALLLAPDGGNPVPDGTVSYLYLHHKGEIFSEIKTVRDTSMELSVRKVAQSCAK